MRYSIFEYSQEKLLEHGLDVTDALILNWFANFFVGKMEKRVFKNGDGKQLLYGWVKISKIMEDLPVIGITSEKGIRRRMDSLVEKGIFDRETVQTQNGKSSFYRTTDIYDSLVNSRVKPAEAEINPQRNSSSYAENDSGNSEHKNPQRTKTTYAKNQAEKTGEKSSQRNSSSYADRNSSTFAERNSSSYALNDMLINNMLITDAAIKSASEKIFGRNAFDDSFPEKAAVFLSSKNILDSESYFDFVKDRVAAKNPDNPRGLAYTLIFQNDIAQEFKDRQTQILLEKQKEIEKAEAEEKRKITCPACGNRFVKDFKTVCPSCEFDIASFSDAGKIAWHKKFIRLPKEMREKYNIESCGFLSDMTLKQKVDYCSTPEGMEMQRKFMHELDKRYGLADTG